LKRLVVYLAAPPYTSQLAEIALDICEKALDKGYDVCLFLYMDGVHLPKRGQRPLCLPNAERRLSTLMARGLRVFSCARCAGARGYGSSGYVHGVEVSSIYKLPELLKSGAKLIALGE